MLNEFRILYSLTILLCLKNCFVFGASVKTAKGDRSFLKNVPRIPFQDETGGSQNDIFIVRESAPRATTPPPVPDPPSFPSGTSDRLIDMEQAKIDFDTLQNRLANFPHSKTTNSTRILKSQVKSNSTNVNVAVIKVPPPYEKLNNSRLSQTKTEIREFEQQLNNLRPENTENEGGGDEETKVGKKQSSSGNSTLVNLLETVLNRGGNNNQQQSQNRKTVANFPPNSRSQQSNRTNKNDVTIIPLPGNTPSWFVTPPPIPEGALAVLSKGEQSPDTNVVPNPFDDTPSDTILITDFTPAGKQLPLFAPALQNSDSEITRLAYHQAGDNRFKWLISYQNPDKSPSRQQPVGVLSLDNDGFQ